MQCVYLVHFSCTYVYMYLMYLQFRQNGEKSDLSSFQPETSCILGNIDWFEQVSYSAICLQLTRGGNQYETMLFLGVLEQVNIAPVFSFPGTFYQLYLNLMPNKMGNFIYFLYFIYYLSLYIRLCVWNFSTF